MFYQLPKNIKTSVKNYPGYFSLFFPNDAHMPQLKIDDVASVKKGVVKIPVGLLQL